MTEARFLAAELGLLELREPLLRGRYRAGLAALGRQLPDLACIHLDAAGWSPEVAAALGDPAYLGKGPARPAFLLVSVAQLDAPLVQPNAGFAGPAYLRWAARARAELADLTTREPVLGCFDHGATGFRDPAQLGLVRELRLEVDTPAGRLGQARELGALRARLLAPGDAWQDEDLLARMREVASGARGLAGVPATLAGGGGFAAGPAYLAEFGGCHVWPNPGDEGPLAWVFAGEPGRGRRGRRAYGPEGVVVLERRASEVVHFLVTRGLARPRPYGRELDLELLGDLEDALDAAHEATGGGEPPPELQELEELRLRAKARPGELDLTAYSVKTRLRAMPTNPGSDQEAWWLDHLKASLDPLLRARLRRAPTGPLSGLVATALEGRRDPTLRREVAA